MEIGDAEEVLFQGLMETLGYAKNRKPFRELARRLPMKRMSLLSWEPRGIRVPALTALLMGAPGLGPLGDSSLDSRVTRALMKCMPSVGSIPYSQWHLFRVRPGNHPRHRILGAAHLLDRYLDVGLI